MPISTPPLRNFQAPEVPDLTPQLGLGQQTEGFGSALTTTPEASDVFSVDRPVEALGAPEPQQERKGVLSDIYNNVASGSAAVGEMIAGIPEFAYSLAAIPQNLLANAIENNAGPGTADWLRANFAQVEHVGPLRAISQVKNYYTGLSKEFQDEVTQFDAGIVESLGKGNFADAGRQVVNSIAQSVPAITAMVATGGASAAAGFGTVGRTAATALPFASGEYQQIENNPNIPDVAKPIVAALKGLSEIVFEQSFGTAKLVDDIVKKSIGVNDVKKFVTGYIEKALASNGVPASIAKGAISEAATTLSQNMVAKYSGENPDLDVWEGVADAAVVGGVMDASIAAPSAVSRSIASRSERKAAQELSTANESILADLNNSELQLTPEEKEALTARYNENDAKITDYVNKAKQEREKLTPAQQKLQDDLLARAQSMEALSEREGLSEETKADLESGIREIESEVEVIQEEAELSAERQAEVDEAISSFQEQNPDITVDPLEDLNDNIVTTFERVEGGLPVDITAVEEASDWMYGKYKELTAMKQDANRRLTIPQIESMQSQLEADIVTLENYRSEQQNAAETEPVFTERQEAEVQPEATVDEVTVGVEAEQTQEAAVEPAVAAETVEVVETPVAEEVVATESVQEPTDGSTVEMPPRIEGGPTQKFEFSEGEWKQRVGRDLTDISDTRKSQVNEAFIAEQPEVVETPPVQESAPVEGIKPEQGQVTPSGQPTTSPSEAVQVIDSENPQKAAEDYQGSFDRLTDNMTPEQIEADPELVRLRDRAQELSQQKGETQNEPIQKSSADKISLEPTSGNRPKVDQGVREQTTEVQQEKSGPQEVESVPKKVKPKKKAPSIKEILASPEARQSRMEELRSRIANRTQSGLRIAKDNKAEAEYWRDVTDYAMIRIVDGAITTAKQLAQELGIKQSSRLNEVFREAKNTITSDPELNVTTARNADTALKRAQFGFDERLPLETESTADVLKEAKQALKDGYDVYGLMARIRGGVRVGANSLETAVLAQYVAYNEAEVIRRGDEMERTKESSYHTFMVHSDARDTAMNNLIQAYDALEISGTVNARALNFRKELVDRDLSLAGMIAERRRAIGGDTVTPEQMAEVEREYRKVLKLSDDIKARNEELLVENSRLDAENRLQKLKQDTADARKKSAKKPRSEQISDIRERRQAAVEDVKAAWAEWTSPGFAATPENKAKSDTKLAKALLNLAQTYLEEGIVNASEIVDKIHGQLSGVIPGLTKRQVMDAIAGSQPDTRPTVEDIRRQLRDFRTELRLLRDIEDAEKGVSRYKEGTRDLEVRNARLDDLRARLKAIRESNVDSELKREADLSKAKKNIERRMKDLQKKISDKDFSKPDRDLLAEDPEIRKLRKQLGQLQFDYRVENKKYELSRRTKSRKYLDAAINIMGIPRAIMATADVSAPLRQGVFVLASHPIMTARAMGQMFRFWNSKANYDDYMAEFRDSPGHDLAIKSGLSISDQASNVQAAAREEDFMSNLVSKIPIFGESFNIKTKVGGREFQIGDLHGRSERAYVGYLNKMRIDLFKMGVELLQNDGINPTDDPSAYKALARYVNAATGRGPLPDSLKTAGAALSTTFFAPRLITSRLYLLTGGPLINAPKVVRQMYIRDLALFVSFGVGILSSAALMGADVEDDPRSSDFGKMRFGDDRYDIWGGFTQYITFLAREITGTRLSTTGKERKLDGSEYDRLTRGDLALRFARSKLAPTTALGVSALQGKNYMGEPFDLGQELLNMSMPLVLQDIAEAVGDKPAWELGLGGAAMMFGVGFQSYSANAFLDKGVDNDLIDLLNDKKAAAMEPEEGAVKIYDTESGEEKKLSGSEFKRYSRVWADYIKSELNGRKSELEKLGDDAFDKEFTKIKRAATSYAKKELSGVESYDLTFESEGIRYKLTPDQVKTRVELMDEYRGRFRHRIYRDRDKLVRKGMPADKALIEATKELDREARADSRDKMLKMNKRKQIELVPQ